MRDWSKLPIKKAVAKSTCYSDSLRFLDVSPNSGNIKHLQRWIEKLNLSTDHFVESRGAKRFHQKQPLKEILVKRSTFANTSRLKQRLIQEGLLEYKCCSCGNTHWLGQPITLQLDHINGNRTDNRLENLRLMCPNCHSQTETYAGKNSKRKSVRKCRVCSKPVSSGALRCLICFRERKERESNPQGR